ncbi:MAG: DUF1189 domain-containing protein [Clostridiales bacterium]|nr:DUF1189 domain-containing protein [Clostridiales bacterium]
MDENMGFMKKFSKSFGDFSVYNVYIKQSMGKAILYLFLICLLFSTVFNIFVTIQLNIVFNEANKVMVSDLPDFSVKDGVLSMNIDKPIEIVENGIYIGFDTTNTVNASKLYQYDKGYLIDQYSIHYKDPSGLSSIKLANIDYLEGLTKDTFISSVNTLKIYLIVFLFIFVPLFIFLLNLFICFAILGLLGLIINAIAETKVRYIDIVKISMYAVTTPILLFAVLNSFGLSLPFLLTSLIYLGIACIYIYLGMRSLEDPKYHIQNYN